MAANNNKTVLLITPSLVIARGLESIFSDLGEFEISGILTDLSRTSELRIKNIAADVIIIDPTIFDFTSRTEVHSSILQDTDAAVVAIPSILMSEEALKQYDEVISIYDEPTAIIRKLRSAYDTRNDSPKSNDEQLSDREKEILVCVAKGMLNKEIAHKFNISIYTVITHRKHITRKIGIKTVSGLTVYALLNNLIDINSFE